MVVHEINMNVLFQIDTEEWITLFGIALITGLLK